MTRQPDEREVAVLATLDTKAEEAVFVADRLRARGLVARIVDVGLGRQAAAAADVTANQVAAAEHTDIPTLRAGQRDAAMATMARGAAYFLRQWVADGRLAGVIGIGGNQGTAICCGAMRTLPIGLPKVMVSTVASGNVRGFVGDSDIVMVFSVGDLLGGPNEITTGVLDRAVGALAGMAATPGLRDDGPDGGGAGVTVAVTAFGNTHRAVMAARAELAQHGVRIVPFHASGASGSAMERLIEAGRFDAVLDLTTHELLAELYPNDIYAPVRPGRLTAAGRRGIPQVVAPGGLEYHCFAAADTIPEAMRGRPTHFHNPNNTNVRANADELRHVAAEMARRLGAARGPVSVHIPLRGWSEVGSPGGVLHDVRANAAFVTTLHECLPPTVPVVEYDATINDESFATAVARALLELLDITSPLAVR